MGPLRNAGKEGLTPRLTSPLFKCEMSGVRVVMMESSMSFEAKKKRHRVIDFFLFYRQRYASILSRSRYQHRTRPETTVSKLTPVHPSKRPRSPSHTSLPSTKRATATVSTTDSPTNTMATANHDQAAQLHTELAKEWSKGAQADLSALKALLIALKVRYPLDPGDRDAVLLTKLT